PRRHRPSLERLESRQLLSVWSGTGGDEHHTATSPWSQGAQLLEGVRWQTPVDLQPQIQDGVLGIHYAEPMVTAMNTVIVPVKVGATDGFRMEAHKGSDGTLMWTRTTDYVLPNLNGAWTPSFPAV